MRGRASILACCALMSGLLAGGCTGLTPQQQTDFNAGLSIAAAATSIYAARSDADPKVVSQLRALLAAAQSAVQSAALSKGAAEQTAAQAALAALVTYEGQLALQPAAAANH